MNTQHQADYIEAVRLRDQADTFLRLPRCVSCEKFSTANGACEMFGPVPAEHVFTPSQCESWAPDIPF